MFDFEKLDVYQHTKEVNIKVLSFINQNSEIDPFILDQWKRASMNVVFQLVASTGRISFQDKRNYLNESRGSVFECVTLLEILKHTNLVDDTLFEELYNDYEKSSKMLLGMFRSFSKERREERAYNNERSYNQEKLYDSEKPFESEKSYDNNDGV